MFCNKRRHQINIVNTVNKPIIIEIPQISDLRGNLSFIEGRNHFPFNIERVFWTYNVPSGQSRGGHSYNKQYEMIVALSGSVDVVTIDESDVKISFHLSRPNIGLLIPPGIWRRMESFSGNAFCLHLSDMHYNVNDYVRIDRR
jgi:dTDP-4-dehydrorhamnose 3,5-epimerase-like enzyme